MKLIYFAALSALAAMGAIASPYKRVCYYFDPTALPVNQLNFTVCTHIIYYGVHFEVSNYTFDWKTQLDADTIATLKVARSKYGFKLTADVEGDYVNLTSSQANMTMFANAGVKFLRESQLDGFDFDWEFPQGKYKEQYATFMKTIRQAFDAAGEPKLILSMAATGVELLIDECYDIPSLGQSIDLLLIMGYDYRSWEEKFYVTAHHSPLYATKYDTIYMNTLNLNWSANHFAAHGFAKEKIILGMPTYAHSYELLTTLDHGMFALATGTANPASLQLPEICEFLNTNGTTRVWDSYAQSPYAYNGKSWYCFDDLQSATVKANYIKANGFGGSMVWALTSDYDPKNKCGTGKTFPYHSRLTDLLA